MLRDQSEFCSRVRKLCLCLHSNINVLRNQNGSISLQPRDNEVPSHHTNFVMKWTKYFQLVKSTPECNCLYVRKLHVIHFWGFLCLNFGCGYFLVSPFLLTFFSSETPAFVFYLLLSTNTDLFRNVSRLHSAIHNQNILFGAFIQIYLNFRWETKPGPIAFNLSVSKKTYELRPHGTMKTQ